MSRTPHSFDKYVGNRVRMRRNMLRMSQERLGQALGVTFQQIQKYERGTNRLGASRIQQIAEVLQIPISFLFEGGPSISQSPELSAERLSTAYVAEFLATSEGLALTRAFMDIGQTKVRRSIVDLVEKIAENQALGSATSNARD
jgi:transcriptional regulator with XRE-family HTH domain